MELPEGLAAFDTPLTCGDAGPLHLMSVCVIRFGCLERHDEECDAGARALPGRRTTLLQLAAQVPAAALADLLHLTPGTATRWTRDAAGDWSRYAAELASERDHQR